MKRILAVAIAAVFTVAFAVSAMADVKIGGEYRLRAEKWTNIDIREDNNPGYRNDDGDGAQYSQRVRLWVVATPTDDTEIKVTVQDSRVWGEYGFYTDDYEGWWSQEQNGVNWGGPDNYAGGPQLTDTMNNMIDVHEAYLKISKLFGSPVSLKIGRQELNYGDQRLIGSFGWSNNGRSFEAWKLTYNNDVADVDFVSAKLADNNIMFYSNPNFDSTPGDNGEDKDLYILYATIKAIPNNTLDLYYIRLQQGNDWWDNTGLGWGSENCPGCGTVTNGFLDTYGFRLKGAVAGIDYTLEMPFQTGEWDVVSGSGVKPDFDADAIALKVGYTLPGANKIRVGAEYNKASGDSDPNDNTVGTFGNLYPTNHDKYGFMDQQGWRNMVAWNINVAGNITEKLSARLDYWNFALDSTKDYWYGAGNWMGSNIGGIRFNDGTGVNCGVGGGTKCKDEVGTEYDLTFKYAYNSAVTIDFGYSRFAPGDYVEGRAEAIDGATSATDDIDWAYLQITGKF